MHKLRVAVLYGGPSREHDVSVKSGVAILNAIDQSVYDVLAIQIDRHNSWHINNTSYKLLDAINYLKAHTDFALLALHGTFGEDGQLQALLESHRIAFSGSGSVASHLAMQKDQANKVLAKNGIRVPKETLYARGYDLEPDTINALNFPVIVKPVAQGSSFGVSKVNQKAHLNDALEKALREDAQALVQEYVVGDEVSAGVIEDANGKLIALPPTQLIPKTADFFDFEAKYTKDATDEITPPKLPRETIDNIQRIACKVHALIKCDGYSRTDMIVSGDTIYVIEINTLPGMTETSILPQQAEAAGITFTELIDMIIKAGLRKHQGVVN